MTTRSTMSARSRRSRLAVWLAVSLLCMCAPLLMELGRHVIGEQAAPGRALFRPPLVVDLRRCAGAVAWLGAFALLLGLYVAVARRLRHRPGRWSAACLNGGLTLVTLVAVVVALECYLRLRPISTDTGALTLGTRDWFEKYCQSNSWGFRGREFDRRKPAHTTRIVVIGDSITFGHGIRRTQDRFTEVLQQGLSDGSGRRYEVINMAECGVTTLQEAGWLEFIAARLEPDLIVLVHVLNDIEDSVASPIRIVDLGAVLEWARARSYLADSLLLPARIRYLPALPYDQELARLYEHPRPWGRHAEVLRWCCRFCRHHRVPLVIAIHPLLTYIDSYPSRLASVHRRIRELCEEESAGCIDLCDAFRGRTASEVIVGRRDRHPNRLGHRLMGQALVEPVMSALAGRAGQTQPGRRARSAPKKTWLMPWNRVAAEAALRERPTSADALLRLASVCHPLEGSKYVALALKQEPHHPRARFLQAQWWIQRFRDDRARDELRVLEQLGSPLADRLRALIP